MRKIIISGVIGGLFGSILASMNFHDNTWQFWALIGLLIANGINYSL